MLSKTSRSPYLIVPIHPLAASVHAQDIVPRRSVAIKRHEPSVDCVSTSPFCLRVDLLTLARLRRGESQLALQQ